MPIKTFALDWAQRPDGNWSLGPFKAQKVVVDPKTGAEST